MPEAKKGGGGGNGNGHGRVPASIGLRNYLDLDGADVIMPHDDAESTRRFAAAVKDAFVDAERCSVFRYQPDVSRCAPLGRLRTFARPVLWAPLTPPPPAQNVRNQTEHVLMLLANIAGRNHWSWADESDLIVAVRSMTRPFLGRGTAASPLPPQPRCYLALTPRVFVTPIGALQKGVRGVQPLVR